MTTNLADIILHVSPRRPRFSINILPVKDLIAFFIYAGYPRRDYGYGCSLSFYADCFIY